MSETDPIRETRTRSRLPLNEDDLKGYGAGQDVNSVSLIEGLSYQKLFLTIVLAAPVAAVFAMMATDLYSALARKIGLRAETQLVLKQPPETAGKEDERLRATLDELTRANKDIASALERQTLALARSAQKERPAQPKEPAAQKNPTQEPSQTTEAKKEKAPQQAEKGKLSVADARKKVKELSGVDIGEPVKSFKPFESIKSKETLRDIAIALDAVISGSKSGDTIRKNAEKAKKTVTARLASLDKKQR